MSERDRDRVEHHDQRHVEAAIRVMPWRSLVRMLQLTVERCQRPEELPPNTRRWLELNRAPVTEQERRDVLADIHRTRAALDLGIEEGWFRERVETLPISGWVVTLCHVLKDGARWWILNAARHDDDAPLLGPVVPVPATRQDLGKLKKIVALAGGDPDRELLRTGAITQADRDELVASGREDVAEYGRIFYWWRA